MFTHACLAARALALRQVSAAYLDCGAETWLLVQTLQRKGPVSRSRAARNRLTRPRSARAVTVSASGVLLPLLVPTVFERVRSSVVSAVYFGLVCPPVPVAQTLPVSSRMHEPVPVLSALVGL